MTGSTVSGSSNTGRGMTDNTTTSNAMTGSSGRSLSRPDRGQAAHSASGQRGGEQSSDSL
jgi:hypothetical protein